MSSARQAVTVAGCVVLWLVLSLILVVWANSGDAWWAQFAPLVPMVLGVLILAPATRTRSHDVRPGSRGGSDGHRTRP